MEPVDHGNVLIDSPGSYLVRRSSMKQITAFLEFEWIFGIGVVCVLLLMFLFYVVYPYDKDLKE
jgi:hypothetical protein